MNALGRGTISIGERQFDVTAVTLEKGKVWIYFTVRGPREPFGGTITVTGADGRECWQGKRWEFTAGVPAGENWGCGYGLAVDVITSAGKVTRIGPAGEILGVLSRETREGESSET